MIFHTFVGIVSQTKKSHTMFNFFKKKHTPKATPKPKKLSKKQLSYQKYMNDNYAAMDNFLKENVMGGKEFTYQELYEKVCEVMPHTKMLHILYPEAAEKRLPYIFAEIRPELKQLFEGYGLSISVNIGNPYTEEPSYVQIKDISLHGE